MSKWGGREGGKDMKGEGMEMSLTTSGRTCMHLFS